MKFKKYFIKFLKLLCLVILITAINIGNGRNVALGRRCNAIRNHAEEIILTELVYI